MRERCPTPAQRSLSAESNTFAAIRISRFRATSQRRRRCAVAQSSGLFPYPRPGAASHVVVLDEAPRAALVNNATVGPYVTIISRPWVRAPRRV